MGLLTLILESFPLPVNLIHISRIKLYFPLTDVAE